MALFSGYLIYNGKMEVYGSDIDRVKISIKEKFLF